MHPVSVKLPLAATHAISDLGYWKDSMYEQSECYQDTLIDEGAGPFLKS